MASLLGHKHFRPQNAGTLKKGFGMESLEKVERKELEVTIDNQKAKGSHLDLGGVSVFPRKYSERSVGFGGLTVIWFAMSVQLALFMSTAQMYPSLSGWQILLALLLAYSLVAVVMWFTQDLGIKYGIPFAVAMRTSFGYMGTQIPAYLRAIPAMFWFGFQTWIGAMAIAAVTNMLFGWSNLLLYIIIFAAIQIVHTYFGIRPVLRISLVATPILIGVGIYLLVLLLSRYDKSFWEVMAMGGKGGGVSLPLGTMVLVGGWATLAVSIQDITRECKVSAEETESWWKSTKKYIAAQWIGLVPASMFFGIIGFVSMVVIGDWNPIVIMTKVIGPESPVMLILCLLFVFLATWSTNDSANLFPPAYVISNTWPSKITFGMGVIIAGVIGVVIQPWKAAPQIITALGVIGGALAPVAGIIICDYYILRRRKININELYTPNGQYKYWKNWNPAALISYGIAIAVSIPVWDYMYIVGMVVSGIAYFFLMKLWIVKVYPQPEITREYR